MEQLILPESEPAAPVARSYPTIAESWGVLGWFLLINRGLILLVLLWLAAAFVLVASLLALARSQAAPTGS